VTFKFTNRDLVVGLISLVAGIGIGKEGSDYRGFERVYVKTDWFKPEIIMAQTSVDFGVHSALKIGLSDGTSQYLVYVPGTFPEVFVTPDFWVRQYPEFNPVEVDKLSTVSASSIKYRANVKSIYE